MRKIALIGYRGSGKTTVGRLLAEACGFDFVDTDQQIEHRTGRTIADIFAADGEAGFRMVERDVIREMAVRSEQVLSVGGGAVLDPENVRDLRSGGMVIWLKASPQELWRRIQDDANSESSRPALTGRPGLDEVVEVLASREALYRNAADLVVETESLSPEGVCQKITELLGGLDDKSR